MNPHPPIENFELLTSKTSYQKIGTTKFKKFPTKNLQKFLP